MIVIYMSEVDFDYEINALVKNMCPEEKVLIKKGVEAALSEAATLFVSLEDTRVSVKTYRGEILCSELKESVDIKPGNWHKLDKKIKNKDRLYYKNAVKRLIFDSVMALEDGMQAFGDLSEAHIKIRRPAWGTLTGVRPSKVAYDLLENTTFLSSDTNAGNHENNPENLLAEKNAKNLSNLINKKIVKNPKIAYDILLEEYYVEPLKARLALEVAGREKSVVERIGIERIKDSYSLYVGIPFCPSTCLYCSFTSYPTGTYANYIKPYVDSLIKEIKFISANYGNIPLTIYIGGGTPGALPEDELYRVLKAIDDNFIVKNTIEYTVEAGRVDCLSREKLRIMKEFGVSRISLNPQTMNDSTLKRNGRTHSVGEFLEMFQIAREEGHDNINTDLIAGLLGENVSDFTKSLNEIINLGPENITVHSLVVKRAGAMRTLLEEEALKVKSTDYYYNRGKGMDEMLSLTEEELPKNQYFPYYMYRQKNADTHFGSSAQDNVGFCMEGFECIYNILMMEEKQSIISAGAGASTKLYDKVSNTVRRVENVKSLKDYIERTDEMINRKGLEL
ncbi:MAG: coproporphyrinogen dehydrogenase HemZ [Lachnospiraceae bacterium]|nr:coproporphyrinogen dehydrogenase HemZ [Lachnospiraceae bacterium]